VISQVRLFSQHLPVNKPHRGQQISQENRIWEDEELAQQDQQERDINGIACDGEDAGRHELARLVCINPDTEALPKDTRLKNKTINPARQQSTPAQEMGPDSKTLCLANVGQLN